MDWNRILGPFHAFWFTTLHTSTSRRTSFCPIGSKSGFQLICAPFWPCKGGNIRSYHTHLGACRLRIHSRSLHEHDFRAHPRPYPSWLVQCFLNCIGTFLDPSHGQLHHLLVRSSSGLHNHIHTHVRQVAGIFYLFLYVRRPSTCKPHNR